MKKSLLSLILICSTILAFGFPGLDEKIPELNSISSEQENQSKQFEVTASDILAHFENPEILGLMVVDAYCFLASCNSQVMCYQPAEGVIMTEADVLDMYDRWEFINCGN